MLAPAVSPATVPWRIRRGLTYGGRSTAPGVFDDDDGGGSGTGSAVMQGSKGSKGSFAAWL
jgi:hypothetical protein